MTLMNDAGFAAKTPSLTARETRSASASTSAPISALRKLAGTSLVVEQPAAQPEEKSNA